MSALTVPASVHQRKRDEPQLVDLAQFGSFGTIPAEDAAKAAANSSTPFDLSKVKDGDTASRPSSTGSGNDFSTSATTCANPSVRVEWRNMAASDKTSFVKAVKCLMDLPPSGNMAGSRNRYEDLVVVHADMTDSIHRAAQFLPFHRYLLAIFEDMLRSECSYTAPMPWWDETLDAGHFAEAPLFTSEYLGTAHLKTADGNGTCVTDGEFAAITVHVGVEGDQCLSRAVDENLTINAGVTVINNCNSMSTYDQMRSCSEFIPHANGHNGIGAVMAHVAGSPSDPAFFMHHSFVDYSWRMWQIYDPDTRLYEINGCSHFTDADHPCTKPITSDYVLDSLGLRPSVTINDVLDTMGDYYCYRYDY